MKRRLHKIIAEYLTELVKGYGVENVGSLVELQDTPDVSKGDFSLNTAMRLAKPAKQPPMKIAERIVEALKSAPDWFRHVAAAPPGFVNLFLSDSAVARVLAEITETLDRSLKDPGPQKNIVVDYSSINIAKQMHVGHLRSTIIGDVLARVLEAGGAKVYRQNHLGDWGLPMAMVIWKAQPVLREIEKRQGDFTAELPLNRLEELYREASRECANSPGIDKMVHEILVQLQNGDKQLLEDWQKITRLSMAEVYRIYELLGVTLKQEHECGESFYRNQLSETVAAIEASGKLVESQGAKCVFLEHFKTKDGSPLPVIVQKSDGGYNYETFDLAGILYRMKRLRADRVIYVTDARQALHFAQVFEVAAVCGWTTPKHMRHPIVGITPDGSVSLEHVPFGSVLGEDNKPLKTRSGENVKLSDLLTEAVDRAFKVVQEKNPQLSEEKKCFVAKAVGIGAVKYADLAQNRNNDYVFSWDRMLALNGNTAPYLQYAHARICSIFRKSGLDEVSLSCQAEIAHPAERALALKIVRFPEAVSIVGKELRPHVLCNFLFELATLFSAFYDQCPVLAAQTEREKFSRLKLCALTRRTIELGLSLLGIDAPREM